VIGHLEDEILEALTQIDDKTAQVPAWSRRSLG